MTEPTRNEIIDAIRHQKATVVWETPKGLLVLQPGANEIIALRGESFSSLLGPKKLSSCLESPILVHGVTGISATDPNWNGLEDIDEMTARNLWGQSLSPGNPAPKSD